MILITRNLRVACSSLLVLTGLLFGGAGVALAEPLVSTIEMRRYNSEDGFLQPMSSPSAGGPGIELLNPQLLTHLVKSPTKIELAFKPTGAPVNLASFKVLYGKARFDITNRIMKKARVGSNSIVVEEAELPEGEHRFAVLISDTDGRSSSREFSVRVQ